MSNQQSAISNQRPSRIWGFGSGRLLVAGCWSLLLATGCVHRSLTIRTDPPGAMVFVNDQLKGSSPVTYDFLWYGWYRLTLRKDGFERLDDHKLLDAPPHLWIPLDLAMEFLPFPVRDTRTWSYILKPLPPLPTPTPPALTSPAKAKQEETPSPGVTAEPPSNPSPTASITTTEPNQRATPTTPTSDTTPNATPRNGAPSPAASLDSTTRHSNDGASQ